MYIFVFHKSLCSSALQLDGSATAYHSAKFHFPDTSTRSLVSMGAGWGGSLIQLYIVLLFGEDWKSMCPSWTHIHAYIHTHTHTHTTSCLKLRQLWQPEVFWGTGFSVRYRLESNYPKLAIAQKREGATLSRGKRFTLLPITPLRSFRHRWKSQQCPDVQPTEIEEGSSLHQPTLHASRRVYNSHLLQKAFSLKKARPYNVVFIFYATKSMGPFHLCRI